MPARTFALIGADGAGKSTQARRLAEESAECCAYVYMGSNPTSATHMLPTTKLWIALKRLCGRTVHHSGPPAVRGRVRPARVLPRIGGHLKSLAMVALKASEEVYRLLVARAALRDGRHVIMDRHPWADYHMSYAGEGEHWLRIGDKLHKLLVERVYPRPDTIILLDAPAEVLHERKPEGSLDALRARTRQYRRAIRAVPRGVSVVVVDVTRPVDEVFEDLRRMIGPVHSEGPSGVPDRIASSMRLPPTLAVTFLALSTSACDGSATTVTPGPRADTLVLMTYNIFHDGERPRHGIASWPERRDAVVDLIRSRSPDVVGLQEAESWQIDWLLEKMPEFEAVARPVVADAGDVDAETVGVLYLRERFEAAGSGHFWYSESPDEPGTRGGAEFGDLASPRMATWVRLLPRGAPDGFYVFNTHFTADDNAADPERARTRSAELMVQRIDARAHPDEHFFVTGDLNTSPGGWPLLYLLGYRCEGEAPCAPASTIASPAMIDAWAARNPGDTEAGTQCVVGSSSDGSRIDYVLVGDPTAGADSCASCARPTVLEAEIVSDGEGCPSDHRPVVATVVPQ